MEISVIALFVSMAAGIAMGPYVIGKLRAFKLGQNIRQEGPESHLAKQGIPSMGGVLFLSVLLIAGLLFSGMIKLFLVPVLYYTFYKEKEA